MRYLWTAVLPLLTLGSGACTAIAGEPAPAKAPAPVGSERWINITYGHTLYPVGDKQWVQVDNKNGNVTKLTETGRNDDYVELYNPERKVTLRLSSTRMEKKVGEEWKRIAQGHWREGDLTEGHAPTLGAPFEAALGVRVVPLSPKILSDFKSDGIPPPLVKIGMVVVGLAPDSPAEVADLRLYDIIYRADNRPIADQAAWDIYRKTLQSGRPTFLHIVRINTNAKRGADRMAEVTGKKQAPKWARRKGVVIPAPAKDVFWKPGQCPLKLLASNVRHNSINTPEVVLSVKNISPHDTVAYTVHLACYNRFDEPVEGLFGLSNSKRGISQTTIKSGHTEISRWTLHFHDTTAKVKITLERVRLRDGSEWNARRNDEVSIIGETGL